MAEDSYRQGNLPMGTQLISFDFASHTMEHLGYLCVDDKTPTDEEMAEVNKVFEENKKFSAPVFDYCEGGNECKAFLMSDRKVRLHRPD
ncbi:uncharacterized protein BO97DRAFT_24051 [Aspergillus homomorphus CBS 101889]|uniref:Uncharacterized protein n=1 Tax=Aspergillus homomorphus (strain CBS 101889) TaxID=1450537 RepID=A0A395HHE6_ASPHC|nr:hypothetical protein BO97DRAFT_24051 [Aspergillus homomorphus CBS 101889]RAL06585.1 hypothetical protein BO97DRAFT_24051 [Aspergillus homomorphus CBS 101889]